MQCHHKGIRLHGYQELQKEIHTKMTANSRPLQIRLQERYSFDIDLDQRPSTGESQETV